MSQLAENASEATLGLNPSSASQPERRQWPMVAHVGLYRSFGAYLAFYEGVVEHLFAALREGKGTVDGFAPPLLFLMRHAMELGYKYTLSELHQMNEEPYDNKAYGKHGLRCLHVALRSQHGKAVEKYGLPDSVVSNFKDYCDKTETGMNQFEALDSTSFNFRYPVDKAGTPNFPPGQTVDLQAIKLTFDDSMILLRHTADVLGEYVDIHRWREAEAHGNW